MFGVALIIRKDRLNIDLGEAVSHDEVASFCSCGREDDRSGAELFQIMELSASRNDMALLKEREMYRAVRAINIAPLTGCCVRIQIVMINRFAPRISSRKRDTLQLPSSLVLYSILEISRLLRPRFRLHPQLNFR